MFSIYGVTGQVFSGTLEEMNRVRALSRARSTLAVAQEGVELGAEAVTGVASRSNDEAVRAYRAMLPPEIERGPLYLAEEIMQRRVIAVADGDDVALAWRMRLSSSLSF